MNKKTLVEILDTKRPSNLQDATLQSLRLAFGKFEDSGFKTVYDSNKIIDPVTKTEFATIEDLKNFLFKFDIPKDIPNKYFGILIEHWYENTTPEQNYSEPTLTKTTLDKDESAQLIAEADKRNKEIADIRESSDKRVQDALRQKQKLIDQRLEQELENKKIKVVATQEIHQGKLTDTDAKEIFDLAKAAKEDPAAVVEAISNRVYASIATAPIEIREAVTKPVIEKSVTSLVEKLEALPVYESMADIPKIFPAFNTVSPLTAFMILNDAKLKGLIHDDEIRAYFVERVQALALTMEAERTVNTSVTGVIGSENFTEFFYGYSEPTNFEIADDQKNEDSMEVSLDDINKYGRDAYKYLNKIKTAKGAVEVTTTSTPIYTPYAYLNSPATTAKTVSIVTKALPVAGAVYGLKTGVFASRWAVQGSKMIGMSQTLQISAFAGMQGTMASKAVNASKFIYSRPIQYINGKFAIGYITGSNSAGVQGITAGASFGQRYLGYHVVKEGTNVTIAKFSSGAIAKGSSTAIAKAGTAVAPKVLVGLSKVASSAVKFMSLAGGWVGLAVGWVLGEALGKLLEKVNWAKVKKFLSEYVLPVAVGGGLIMFGAPVAGLVAGGVLFGAARGATLASMTAGTLGVLGFIGSSIGIAIATPVIISIIVIPPLIAFIMLVINNSAYVVPPSLSGSGIGRISSPYIDIVKNASPAGPLKNTDLPTEVTYTVTIKAKKNALTNIKITDTCQVISRDNVPCPDFNLPVAPASISPTTPFVFTYSANLSTGFGDSVVINTIQVTADTLEQSGATTEASNSLTIGNPPISCPVPGAKPLNSMNYSYSSNDTGHGSTAYWGGTTPYYHLPQGTSCMKPADCPYYGYAYDVFPNGTTEVFAPSVLGKDVNWNCSYAFSNGGGSAGHTYHCLSTGNNYLLVLTHMNKNAKTGLIKSGEKIGSLYNQGGNTHLHLEFQLNGKWEKPENYFCK